MLGKWLLLDLIISYDILILCEFNLAGFSPFMYLNFTASCNGDF